MNYEDYINILKLLAPYGINLIPDFSNKEDLIFKVLVPKNSKCKKSNRYIKGEAAARLVKNTINSYMDSNNISCSYGIDFEEIDTTWTEDNKTIIDDIIKIA